MKIMDVTIENIDGKIVLCRRNKRGNIKYDYVDITGKFLDCIVECSVSEEGKIYIYTSSKGKHYNINVTEMSDEEFLRRKKVREVKSKKALTCLSGIMATFMAHSMNID